MTGGFQEWALIDALSDDELLSRLTTVGHLSRTAAALLVAERRPEAGRGYPDSARPRPRRLTVPDMQLPLFEGIQVRNLSTGLTGKVTAGGAQPARAMHIGEEVIVLVRGTVTKVAHQDSDEGLTRIHTVKVAEVHELEEGEAALLLTEARKATERALDELLGRSQLPFDPDTGEVE